ncbi:MAG: endonuclease/exonuclease/phosphatase family protein [Planctomycetaceae bacterium]
MLGHSRLGSPWLGSPWLGCVVLHAYLLLTCSLANASENVRVATFNCSMNRNEAGQLLSDLQNGSNRQLQKVASVIRRVRPDVVLLNEFDFDAAMDAIRLFQTHYLDVQPSEDVGFLRGDPLRYPHVLSLPVNTGVPSGRDFDHDGKTDGPADAIGFGRFPGQYGMVILSKFPIDRTGIRTFKDLKWNAMPEAVLPIDPATSRPWYSVEDLQHLSLSSKSHWDVPISFPGRTIHVLASHPTPPAFDGPEDRNGRRNHDEIRLWADYVSDKDWIVDDAGLSGGLSNDAPFIILGDLNADPVDGDTHNHAIDLLLKHSRVQPEPTPTSSGAIYAAENQGERNRSHRGPHAHDTADFGDRSVGNLRVDYVLPSRDLRIVASGVFWPRPDEPDFDLIDCSDHRLVWIDLQLD